MLIVTESKYIDETETDEKQMLTTRGMDKFSSPFTIEMEFCSTRSPVVD